MFILVVTESVIYEINSCTLQTYKIKSPKLIKLMFHLEQQIYKYSCSLMENKSYYIKQSFHPF